VDREIELRHFRYVLAVAEEGSFTAAAARLGMTQPALSRAIRSVEAVVGTALFERGHLGATLTAAGRALRDDARVVDEAARAAVTRASRQSREGRHLRITARGCDIDTLGRLVISYNATCVAHPPAHGVVVDGSIQLDEVCTGDADVTLVRSPAHRRGLDSKLIQSDRRVALLPVAHPLATRPMIDRAELEGEPVPVWPGNTVEQEAYWAGADLVPYRWRPGPVVTNAALYTASIRLGQAIGFVPESLLPELVLTGISVVRVSELSASELRLAWPESASSRDVAHFVRHASDSMAA
jgi:DNA-binding transcriptional LysR family regulator